MSTKAEIDKQIKEFIKENLSIVVDLDDKSGSGNSVLIGLKFEGEDKVFGRDVIYIPDN